MLPKIAQDFFESCSEIAQELLRTKKYQENSAHPFEDNYLANHLVKFLQDSIKP